MTKDRVALLEGLLQDVLDGQPYFDTCLGRDLEGRIEAALATHEINPEIQRLQARLVDGHCRKCACDDCARFYREIDRV